MLGLMENGRKLWLQGPVVPGDEVRFRPEGKGGVVLGVTQPAPERVPAPCPLFESCPGCALQPLPYARQLELKGQRIVETLKRLGGQATVPFQGVVGSSDALGTRNKLDFSVEGPVLGYRTRSGLLEVPDCLLGDALLRFWIPRVRQWLRTHPAHGLHRVLLRTNGDRSGVWLLMRGTLSSEERRDLVAWGRESSELRGIGIQPDWKQPWECVLGELTLQFSLADQAHTVEADGFFQVHDALADPLVRTALEQLPVGAGDAVLDLFCGTGALTLPAKAKTGVALGLDARPGRGPFQAVDLRRGLPVALLRRSWQAVITDPPRAGMEKKLTEQIRDQIAPGCVVYVSCNPATLARDVQRLTARGTYAVTFVQGFDLFPQTPHVETLCVLKKQGEEEGDSRLAPPASMR
jgi:23S rRNA (uracil1939-C5)-methyltransferase